MYIIDSNIFIEAKNRYYAFDIVPAFWEWMDSVLGPNVCTIVPVSDELIAGKDELSDWMKSRRNSSWVLSVDDGATQDAFANLANELMAPASQYTVTASSKFLDVADPWVVAKAEVLEAPVVTHEVPAPHAKSRVPMANLCEPRGIVCIDTFDAMRALGGCFTA